MTNLVQKLAAILAIGLALQFGGASPSLAASPAQRSFASPDEAAAALAQAARADDQSALRAIFGPGHDALLSSGDRYADREQLHRFIVAYDEKRVLVTQATGRVVLEVGPEEWPLPIPIVERDGRWLFDTQAGAEEMIDRRIGRNELATIRVLLTYVEAQKEFFADTAKQTGKGYYAQRLISRPGKQDGLYWPASGSAEESPFGPLVAQAMEEGYPGQVSGAKRIPYQGYYYRILTAQGPSAPGGALDYMQSDRMTRGYALLAWPATYGASGIMTFQVNQDGIVFQKDLGPDTAHQADGIARFDPDLTWARVTPTAQ